MIILSWDVGIKHLAYCLIDSTSNNILDWNIINLIEDTDCKCHGFISNNSIKNECDKKPIFEYNNNNITYYFCNLHKRQFEKIDNEVNNILNYNGNETCEIIKCNKNICGKNAKYKIINNNCTKFCCNLHYKNITLKNNILKKINNKNTNKIPIENLKFNLINSLDKINFPNIDYILIENQPSLKNPKMKGIADTLYSWFLIRGIIDKKIKILKIFYISPSNKLKINDIDLNKEIDKLKNNSKYKNTKNLAVIHTKNILNNEKWLNFLESNKKKDDLCDCYLQGLYFINNKHKFL